MQTTALQHRTNNPVRTLSTGIAAGLAGGAAEVVWIALFAQFSGRDAAAVADGVTGTVFPALAASGTAVPLGIVVHMGLAVLLGAAIAFALRAAIPKLVGTLLEPLTVVAVLIGVWAVNFFVVLPMINPGFVELVPLGIALISKVLFGTAAAFVLYSRSRSAARSELE